MKSEKENKYILIIILLCLISLMSKLTKGLWLFWYIVSSWVSSLSFLGAILLVIYASSRYKKNKVLKLLFISMCIFIIYYLCKHFSFRWYDFFVVLSIISSLIVSYIYAKKEGIKKDKLIPMILYIAIGAIYGGRYLAFLIYIKYNGGVFCFYNSSIAAYGSAIGVFVTLYLYSKLYKIDYKKVLYPFFVSIPLFYSVGKLACFAQGCCYGILYDGPFNYVYRHSESAPNNVPLFPIQLVETISFFLIFLYTIWRTKKEKNKGFIIGEVLICCCTVKFFLDFLRASHVGQIISINQIISIILILIGIIITIKHKKKNRL